MNTYKLYIGRLNVVKGINYPKSNNGKMPIVTVHDIKIESNFSKFVLVKIRKHDFKDIITDDKYLYPRIFMNENDRYIDTKSLIPFNDYFDNKKKYLSKRKVKSYLDL